MTCCLRHLGLASSFGVDHLRSKNIAAPASIADLTTSEGQQLLQTWLKNPFVVGLFLAPPYGTASRARATPLKRKHGEKLGPGPPPLRNDAHPNGIPGLNFKDKLRIGKANVLYHLTSRLVQQAVNLGMMLCVQNPQYSHFWQTTFWLEVSHLLKYSVFHSCQYGSPRLTRTMLAFNCNEFFTVSLKCPGVSAKHKHAKWGVTAARPLAPAQETAYPMSLARSVAACYVNHLLSCGIKPLPETMDALTSHSAETLTLSRAHGGVQPRASKLPPLLPLFSAKFLIHNPPAELLCLALHSKVARDVALSSTFLPVLPKGSKLLTILPTPSSILSGGMMVEEFRGHAHAVANDESLNVDTSRMSQIWGVPWSELQFIDKAVSTGHPMLTKTCIPDELKEAVEIFASTSMAQRMSHRAGVLKFWIDRAKFLAADEKRLHNSLPDGVSQVLLGKRLLVWKEMLSSIHHVDMPVVDEMIYGVHLVGEAAKTGIWPSKFAPAAMTVAELCNTARRERAGILTQFKRESEPGIAEIVWQQTIEETKTGALVGPMSLADVPDSFPLSRRFGVSQGSKVRCVDDFTRSAVNLATQTTESPKPHTLDVVSSLVVHIMNSLGNRFDWQGRAFDLKGAYRQCPVNPSSYKYAHIAVVCPDDERAYAFRMNALPFGSVMSVHSFLRVSFSLWVLAVRLLRVLWCNYYDDFVTFAPRLEVDSISNCVHTFFKIVGWRFAETGEKAPPFNCAFSALGIKIDLSAMQGGTVLFDNTEKRTQELLSSLSKVLISGKLSRHEALRLRGRLQFACGQLFGRIGKASLAVLTFHAYAAVSSLLSNEAIVALQSFVRLLTISEPRKILRHEGHPWFLFTDAAFEEKGGVFFARIGAVLVDGHGVCRQFFSEVLDDCMLKDLNVSKRSTIIFELEMLAILCGFHVWQNVLKNQHLVVFTDNNGARDCIISCTTQSLNAVPILKCLLEKEYKLGAHVWYSRVPTDSNIADAPSRAVISQLTEMGVLKVDVDTRAIVRLVIEARGGAEPVVPTPRV